MNSFTGHTRLFHHGEIYQVAVPFDGEPGFAIPLVQSAWNSNAQYVQRADIYNRVVGYEAFSDQQRTARIDTHIETKIGGDEIFGLIDPSGHAHAGTQRVLAPLVSEWIETVSAPLSRFNFAQFAGDEEQATQAAQAAISAKTEQFGNAARATKWFIECALLREIVSILLKSSEGQLSMFDVDFSRLPPIKVEVTPSRVIHIELPANIYQMSNVKIKKKKSLDYIFGKIHRITGYELATIGELGAESEPMFEGISEGSSKAEHAWARSKAMQIGRLGRQEYRLASVMDALMERPQAANQLLSLYSDKAAYCQRIVRILQYHINSTMSPRAVEDKLSDILPIAISSAHPMRMGETILEFARVLRHRPSLNAVLKHEATRRQAQDVTALREAILDELASSEHS